MTRKASPQAGTSAVVMLFAAILILAGVARAQRTDAGQPSAISASAWADILSQPWFHSPLRATPALYPRLKNAAASESTTANFLPASTYYTGGGDVSSVIVADLDGDGTPDIVVANWGGQANGDGSVAVFLGNGDGTFQPASVYDAGGKYSTSVVVADVNGDGKPDLIVASGSSSCCQSTGVVGILLGNGNGTFQPVVTYSTAAYGFNGLAVADLNGDGKPDLIVASSCLVNSPTCPGDGAVSVLLGNGDGTFGTAVVYDSGGSGTSSVVVADLAGNSIPDVIVLSPLGSGGVGDGVVGVLLGNGNGTLQNVMAYDTGTFYTSNLAVATLIPGGTPDIITAGFFDQLIGGKTYAGFAFKVMLNNGSGGFPTDGFYPTDEVISLIVADVNNDGIPDLVMSSTDVLVYLGKGDGTFPLGPTSITPAGGALSSLAVADINGDGKPDVVVCNSQGNTNDGAPPSSIGLLLGHGDGTFQPVQSYSLTGWDSGGVTIADLTGNGEPDVVALNQCVSEYSCSSSMNVLLNNTIRPYNPTSTALVSSANPAATDQTITYIATIASNNGGVATGTVTFTDQPPNCRFINCRPTVTTVPVTNNQAVYTAAYKGKTSRIVTAEYSGDANNGFSTSAPFTEVIATLPVSSQTTLVTSASPTVVGQAVTFTATVTWKYGTAPNGELVTFYDDDAVIGTANTADGVASLTTSSLPIKSQIIKATYAGDSDFAPSSGTVRQIVTGHPTTTTLTSSLNPSIYGQGVTWTAVVTTAGPVPPTGNVNFNWTLWGATYSIGSAPLSASGVATLTRSNLNANLYPMSAVYVGDANNLGSASPILNQVITQATSTVTLISSPNPSTQGEAVTFTAEITSPTVVPTGPVTFTAGKTTLGTIELSKGKATLTTSTLAVGSTTVTVTYPWNSNISESSASVTQVVQQ